MLKKNTLRSKNPLQSRSEVWLRNIVVSVMLAFYLVFYIIPIFIALDGSFHIWNPLNGKYVFNGLKNYERLLKNDLFWTSGLNTVIFCLGVTVGRAALGFACAYAIYSKLVTKKNFFRGVLYMPVISPMVGVAFVWKFMYNPQFGLINKIFGTDINWLMNADTALGAVMAMTIWKDFGYAVVLYMAALLARLGQTAHHHYPSDQPHHLFHCGFLPDQLPAGLRSGSGPYRRRPRHHDLPHQLYHLQ